MPDQCPQMGAHEGREGVVAEFVGDLERGFEPGHVGKPGGERPRRLFDGGKQQAGSRHEGENGVSGKVCCAGDRIVPQPGNGRQATVHDCVAPGAGMPHVGKAGRRGAHEPPGQACHEAQDERISQGDVEVPQGFSGGPEFELPGQPDRGHQHQDGSPVPGVDESQERIIGFMPLVGQIGQIGPLGSCFAGTVVGDS